MQGIEEAAKQLREVMAWTDSLTPDLRPGLKVAKILNSLLESGLEINRDNISSILYEIVKENKDK